MQKFTNQKADRGWKVHLVCFYFLHCCFVLPNEFSEMTLLFEMLSKILFSFMKCWVSEMPSCFWFCWFISEMLVCFAPQGCHRQKTQKTQREVWNTDNTQPTTQRQSSEDKKSVCKFCQVLFSQHSKHLSTNWNKQVFKCKKIPPPLNYPIQHGMISFSLPFLSTWNTVIHLCYKMQVFTTTKQHKEKYNYSAVFHAICYCKLTETKIITVK